MALDCICIPVRDMEICIPFPDRQGKPELPERANFISGKRERTPDIDLCKILERSQDGHQKHDDFGCHYQGERRQNLINKLKMYLDDYDDRPVMKRTSGDGKRQGQTGGQTGFGPMIRYPGYVDYNHPYFSSPFNRMPTLATTVNQKPGGNPCLPYPLTTEDPERPTGHRGRETSVGAVGGGRGRHQVGEGEEEDHGCQCARRRGQEPRCPAANTRNNNN